MINKESGKEIYQYNPKVIIISLLYVGILIWLATIIASTLLAWEVGWELKLIIGLMTLKFYLESIVYPSSNMVVKILEGITAKKGLIESMGEIIEKEEEQ